MFAVSAVRRNVLNDHVDADVGFRQWSEDRGRNARPVFHLADGNLRLIARIGDAADNMLFHDLILIAYECSGPRPIGSILIGRSGGIEA